jgi:hypothetical protein
MIESHVSYLIAIALVMLLDLMNICKNLRYWWKQTTISREVGAEISESDNCRRRHRVD